MPFYSSFFYTSSTRAWEGDRKPWLSVTMSGCDAHEWPTAACQGGKRNIPPKANVHPTSPEPSPPVNSLFHGGLGSVISDTWNQLGRYARVIKPFPSTRHTLHEASCWPLRNCWIHLDSFRYTQMHFWKGLRMIAFVSIWLSPKIWVPPANARSACSHFRQDFCLPLKKKPFLETPCDSPLFFLFIFTVNPQYFCFFNDKASKALAVSASNSAHVSLQIPEDNAHGYYFLRMWWGILQGCNLMSSQLSSPCPGCRRLWRPQAHLLGPGVAPTGPLDRPVESQDQLLDLLLNLSVSAARKTARPVGLCPQCRHLGSWLAAVRSGQATLPHWKMGLIV